MPWAVRCSIAVVMGSLACSLAPSDLDATPGSDGNSPMGASEDQLVAASGTGSTAATTDPTLASGFGTGDQALTSGSTDSSSTSGNSDPLSGTDTSSGGGESGGREPAVRIDLGGGFDPACPLDCAAPCDVVIDPGFDTFAELLAADGAMATRSTVGEVAVFDTTTLSLLYAEPAVAWMDLGAGMLVTSDAAEVTVRSTADWAVTATIPAWAESGGIAVDGSYVWTASPLGLDVYGLDGSFLASTQGDYTGANALALTDALHVVTSVGTPNTVRHFDLATASLSYTAFSGHFGGWSASTPRYWSNDGLTHHVYAVDGTELFAGAGAAYHVWGDRLWGTDGVVDLGDPTTVLAKPTADVWRMSGPMVSTYGLETGLGQLVDLGAAFPDTSDFVPPLGIEQGKWHFAVDGPRWVIGLADGTLVNDLGATATVAPVPAAPAIGLDVRGATGGFAVARSVHDVEVWRVVGGCTATPIGNVTHEGGPWTVTGDGTVVLAWEQGNPWERGTSAYAVAGAIDLGFFGTGAPELSYFRGWNVAAAANEFAQMWEKTTAFYAFANDPYEDMALWSAMTNVLPAISPDGSTIVTTTFPGFGPGSTWEDAVSTVRVHGVVVASFDGVTRGLLDDDHMVVSRYEDPGALCQGSTGSCDLFLGSEIVGLDGVPIQATPLPDIGTFRRISDTEVFVDDPPRIYDAYSGVELWSTPNDSASPIGPDRVVSLVNGDVVITRWR